MAWSVLILLVTLVVVADASNRTSSHISFQVHSYDDKGGLAVFSRSTLRL
jgi:hypothetical protein